MKGWLSFYICLILSYFVYGSIKIYSPSNLKDQFEGIYNLIVGVTIRYSYANYGRIPYGSVMVSILYLQVGRVYYFPDSSSFCTKNDSIMLDREGDPDNDFTPIVLVECDGCTFVRKSKNVQDIGGALMLIMTHTARQNPDDMVMIDDGTGTSIAIITMQINRAIVERQTNRLD